MRCRSALSARRSSGVIFPAIGLLFLAKQTVELGVDVHQHSNDAIDRLTVERRLLLLSPHFAIVSAASAPRKMSRTD